MQGSPIAEHLWPQIEQLVAKFVGRDQLTKDQSFHLRKLILENFTQPVQLGASLSNQRPLPDVPNVSKSASVPPKAAPKKNNNSTVAQSSSLSPPPPAAGGSNLGSANPKWPAPVSGGGPTANRDAPKNLSQPTTIKKFGLQPLNTISAQQVPPQSPASSSSSSPSSSSSSSSASSGGIRAARDFFQRLSQKNAGSSPPALPKPLGLRTSGSRAVLPPPSEPPLAAAASAAEQTTTTAPIPSNSLSEESPVALVVNPTLPPPPLDETATEPVVTPAPAPAPRTAPEPILAPLRGYNDISLLISQSKDAAKPSEPAPAPIPGSQRPPKPRSVSETISSLASKFQSKGPSYGSESGAAPPQPRPDPASRTLPTQRGECQVCFQEDIELVQLSKCEHEPTMCRACTTEWVAKTASQAQVPLCSFCREPINYSDVKIILKDDVNMFRMYASLKTGLLPGGYVWCASPDCGAAQKPDANGLMTCRSCQRRTCATHGALVLPKSEFCCEIGKADFEQAEQRRLQQNELDVAASEAAIAGLTRPCPSCGVKIEKNGGCMHMTCTRCRYEWFWCCSRNYRDPSQAQMHRQQCQY